MTRVLTRAVRSALGELSDFEYQARVWTGRDRRGEMSSFVECVSRLYDDSGLEDALSDDLDVFGAPVDDGLRVLGDLLARVDNGQVPNQLIADVRMEQIRAQAAALLAAIGGASDAAP